MSQKEKRQCGMLVGMPQLTPVMQRFKVPQIRGVRGFKGSSEMLKEKDKSY
jgi:hypothetical protein